MNRKLTHNEFISRLYSIKPFIRCAEGQRYNGSFYKLKFICSLNHEFEATPSNILKKETIGCKLCSAIKMSEERIKSQSLFIDQVREIHPGYSVIGEYLGCFRKVEVLCDKGHTFKSRANDLISGSGCSLCRTSGYKDNLPGILYYIRIDHEGEVFYKIGITNLSLNKRFSLPERSKIKVLMQEVYDNGLFARLAEKQILHSFNEFLVRGVNVFKKGNTEIFNKDVLCLDN